MHASIIALASLIFALVVALLAHRNLLTFRYALGWFFLAGIGMLSSVFTWLIAPLSSVLSLSAAGLVSAVGVLVLLSICLQLSISISGLQHQTRRLAEESALLKAVCHQKPESSDVLVIVPALNEERSIRAVVGELLLNELDVLVVDDGSTDSTRQFAIGAGAAVVSMPYNTGVGGALRTGLRYAVNHQYRTVVQCDADGQHPVSHIRALLAALKDDNCDMVIGSRFTTGQAEYMSVSAIRRFAMWTLATSASRVVGSRITDVTSGFRALQGDLVLALADHLPAYYLGDTYEAVIAAGRAGYRVKEIPSPIGERLFGNSSANSLQAARFTVRAFLTAVLRLHVRLPVARR